LPPDGTSGMAERRRAWRIAPAEGMRMGIADDLTALRRDFPGCRVVTFADLSSGLVLFTSAEARLPQERLDAFFRRAASLLNGPAANAGAAVLGTPIHHAVVPEGDGLLMALRSPAEPDEVVICQCDADIDLSAFAARAAGALARLGAGH
jgi:hypothetical protein